VKTISREDLKEKIDRGDEFVLLEVLSEASYGGPIYQVRSGSRIWTRSPTSCLTRIPRWWRTARTSIDTPRRGSSVS
jgi:hypothetical protein